MCTGLYQKLQQYYADKEWELMELALAFISRGWYANVTWHHGKLMLIVKGPRTLRAERAWKRRVANIE